MTRHGAQNTLFSVGKQRPLSCPRRRVVRSFLFGRSQQPCDNNDEEGNALLELMSRAGVDFGPLKSGLFSSGMGRGLYATTLILPGQRICSIDISHMITVDSAVEYLAKVMPGAENLRSHDPWAVLALFLCMMSSERYNESTYMIQYRRVLPTFVDTVLEWDQDDVNLLRGSHLHTIAEQIREFAHDTVADVMNANAPDIDEESIRWSLSILLSRLVRLETAAGETILVLCPGLDFLNMSCDSTSFISLDRDQHVYIKSDRLYKPGDQVCISYGEKTSGELYLSYGFYPDENPHDACLFSIHADSITLIQEMKQLGIPEHNVFPLRLEGLPEGLLRYAAIISLSEDNVDLLPSLHALRADKDLPLHHMKRSLGWLSKMIRETLSRFNMPLNECKHILEQTKENDRKHIIAHMMLQEQRILNKSMFIIDSMRRQM